jgi:D-alanyl-D-alanine carboxypeptidase
LIYHGGETVGYNSKMAVETTNDVTLVLWTTLTVDVDKEQQTANTLMLKVLDQIMVQSPLAVTAADLTVPPTTS